MNNLADGQTVHMDPATAGYHDTSRVSADTNTKSASSSPSPPTQPSSPKPPPNTQETVKRLQKFADIGLWETSKDENDDDDGEVFEVQAPKKWYRSSTCYTWLILVVLSGALLTAGVILHQLPDVADAINIAPFRWLYFFGAWPALWVLSRLVTWQCFKLAEWYFYREALYFWRSVQHTGCLLLFSLVNLIWFNVVFNWAWCDGKRCDDPDYDKAKEVLWRLVLCLSLFSLANFIKCVVAKAMSSHFYSTTHFNTVKRELEKEYYLLALSQPRDELLATQDNTGLYKFSKRLRSQPEVMNEEKDLKGPPDQQARQHMNWTSGSSQRTNTGEVDRYKHVLELAEGATHHHEVTAQVMGSKIPAASPQLCKVMSSKRKPSDSCLFSVKESGDVESGTRESMERPASRSLDGVKEPSFPGKPDGFKGAKSGHSDPTTYAQMFQQMANPGDLLRLRTVMAIKTVTALVKRYQATCNEEEEKKLMRTARKFARGLFWNIKGSAPRDHLLLEDFYLFFDGDKSKAKEAYACFDADSNGQITLEETVQSVEKIVEDRRNVAASLRDTDSIVSSLEGAIGLVVHFIFFLLYLPIWGVGILEGFNALSATVLALAFIFGDSLKNMYENAVYLFVEHPYDVGDLVWVDNSYWRVKRIDLLYTVLLKGTGERVYYPNRRLRENTLMNLTKSNNQWDSVQLLMDTSRAHPDLLMKLDTAMREHMAKSPGDYAKDGDPVAHFRNIEDPVKIRLALSWPYSFKSDQLMRVFKTRSRMLETITEVLNAEGVVYTLPYKDLSWQQASARWAPPPVAT